MVTPLHIVFMAATLAIISVIGVCSGRKIKSASDFSVGGKQAGPMLVAATILGTLVGGAATIGTAQLAFTYGFSAWWFTLGGGIACLVLGLILAKPLYNSNCETIPQLLVETYGGRVGITASVFLSIGTFLNLVAQVLAAVSLLTSLFSIADTMAALIAVVLIIIYVSFGGVWGASLVGLAKTVLLFGSLLVSGFVALSKTGGWPGLRAAFPGYPWFSLFGRGLASDLAAAFSVIVGVVSTQSYVQAIVSGRDEKSARNGALIAAVLAAAAGIPGVLVGLFMRANFPGLDPSQAFPAFILRFLPPWLGGMAIATLLIAVVGTGGGLALGISTVLTRDVYQSYLAPNSGPRRNLLVSRSIIIGVSLLSLLLVISGQLKSLILEWTYLSMGLRGATVCLPLIAALFWGNRINPSAGRGAVLLGPSAVILWRLFGFQIDPLYPGLVISGVTLVLGSTGKRRKADSGGDLL